MMRTGGVPYGCLTALFRRTHRIVETRCLGVAEVRAIRAACVLIN